MKNKSLFVVSFLILVIAINVFSATDMRSAKLGETWEIDRFQMDIAKGLYAMPNVAWDDEFANSFTKVFELKKGDLVKICQKVKNRAGGSDLFLVELNDEIYGYIYFAKMTGNKKKVPKFEPKELTEADVYSTYKADFKANVSPGQFWLTFTDLVKINRLPIVSGDDLVNLNNFIDYLPVGSLVFVRAIQENDDGSLYVYAEISISSRDVVDYTGWFLADEIKNAVKSNLVE